MLIQLTQQSNASLVDLFLTEWKQKNQIFSILVVLTPKRVTSDGDHFRGLAAGQHSSEKTSQWWQAISDTVTDLTGPVIELQIPRFTANRKIKSTQHTCFITNDFICALSKLSVYQTI